MKRFLILVMLGLFLAPVVGCRVDADADDDDAHLKVDVDD
jgi:hypothetical protein